MDHRDPLGVHAAGGGKTPGFAWDLDDIVNVSNSLQYMMRDWESEFDAPRDDSPGAHAAVDVDSGVGTGKQRQQQQMYLLPTTVPYKQVLPSYNQQQQQQVRVRGLELYKVACTKFRPFVRVCECVSV